MLTHTAQISSIQYREAMSHTATIALLLRPSSPPHRPMCESRVVAARFLCAALRHIVSFVSLFVALIVVVSRGEMWGMEEAHEVGVWCAPRA